MEAVGGEGTVLKGCLGKASLEKRKELYESLEQMAPGRGQSKCKGPEAAYSRHSK